MSSCSYMQQYVIQNTLFGKESQGQVTVTLLRIPVKVYDLVEVTVT